MLFFVFYHQCSLRSYDCSIRNLDRLAGQHVNATLEAFCNLRIVRPWNVLVFKSVVDEHENHIILVIAEISICIVAGHEVHGLAVVDHVSCLSPLEETAYLVEEVGSLTLLHLETVGVVSLRLTALLSEKVDLIALPSAWEVDTQARVVTYIVRSS